MSGQQPQPLDDDGPAGDRAEQSMARVLETGEPQYNENLAAPERSPNRG